MICNKFYVSHNFNKFRLQSWSFPHSGFIQDTQRTHSVCRIHLFEQFANLHIWIENLILFHRSVIWAGNCHKWIITSNDWFHFSIFSAFRTFLFSTENFRHEVINFVKSAKTSFWTPWPKKCTRELRTTLLVHYPPSQDRLADFSQATRSKQPAEPKRHGRGPHRLTSSRKRWTSIYSHFSVAVKRKTWKSAAHTEN